MSDIVFVPPGESWIGLSTNYLKARRVGVLIKWPILFAIIAAGLGLVLRSWWPAIVCGGVALVWIPFQYWRQGRVFRRWGYVERETDLYVSRGVLFRNLTIIPYGRMQVVEVSAGPIDRAFGVASVQMTTAGPTVTVPGLSAADAAALRDRLSERGQDQQAGL